MMHKICASLGATVVASMAGASGLTQIPIADILRHREGSVSVGASGMEPRISKGYSFSASASVGLFERVELGGSHDFMGHGLLDGQILLAEGQTWALGAGISGFDGRRSDSHFVGRYDFHGYRLHAGLSNWKTPFAGVDFPIGEFAAGSVDYVEGTGAGVCLDYFPAWLQGICVSASVTVPERRSEGVGHSLTLSYGFRF